VADLIDKAAKVMHGRDNDAGYSFARFMGVCHESIEGNLSLGSWNKARQIDSGDSHGDAGCFLIDVTGKWRVYCCGGYGFSQTTDSKRRNFVIAHNWPEPTIKIDAESKEDAANIETLLKILDKGSSLHNTVAKLNRLMVNL